MFTFLIVLEIVICFFLIIAILMQNSKGGGLTGGLGGSNLGAVFGARRASDFLTKATTYLAGAFMVLALIVNIFFLPGKGKSSSNSIIQTGQSTVPPAQIPQQQPTPGNPTK